VRRLAVIVSLLAVSLSGILATGADAAEPGPLAKVTVEGEAGQKPTVKFAAPFSTAKTVHTVVVPGTGDKLAKGQTITFDYLVVDGRTGKELTTSFGSTPGSARLDASQVTPGIVSGFLAAKVGSRVLVAVAPKEGIAKGLASSGVKKNDTLLFVFDVKTVRAPLGRAQGAAVTPPSGLPTVKLDSTGKPTITVPGAGADAPGGLVVQPLIVGTGPVVTAGQTISVHYTGVIFGSGKQFDSSWDRGTPVDFAIGIGKVIKGWDEGIVGLTVGSQVLLVVPPDKGYGTSGNASAGISGTDALVFVVDILDAY
jgi:peptidylprolyl isomerase